MKNNLQKVSRGKSLFTAYENEKIILITRSHWISLIPPLLLIFFLLVTFISLFTLAFFVLHIPLALYLSISVFVTLTCSLFTTQKIIEWYFHMYIVSDKKIVEIIHSPLFFGKVTEILLSQVRCTEVDSEMDGFLHHIIDVGHVTITFDRPTHEREFILKNIKHPNLVCIHLSSFLMSQSKNQTGQGLWIPDRDDRKNQIYIEELQQQGEVRGI